MSFENTVGKEKKMLMMSNFSFSSSVFHPFGELAAVFSLNLKFLSSNSEFGKSPNLLYDKGLIYVPSSSLQHFKLFFDIPWQCLPVVPYPHIVFKGLCQGHKTIG